MEISDAHMVLSPNYALVFMPTQGSAYNVHDTNFVTRIICVPPDFFVTVRICQVAHTSHIEFVLH